MKLALLLSITLTTLTSCSNPSIDTKTQGMDREIYLPLNAEKQTLIKQTITNSLPKTAIQYVNLANGNFDVSKCQTAQANIDICFEWETTYYSKTINIIEAPTREEHQNKPL